MSRPEATRPRSSPRWPGTLVRGLLALAMLSLVGAIWLDIQVRAAGRPELAQFTPETSPFVVVVVSSLTIGTVIGLRRPRHPVGWLLLALGLTVAVSGVLDGYVWYGVRARPGALPGARHLATLADGTFIAWPALIGFVLLLTPTGSLPSPRWRWWARAMAVTPVVFLVVAVFGSETLPEDYHDPGQSIPNPLAVTALTGLRPAGAVIALIAQFGVVAGAASLAGRFRRARGPERQQLRWVAYAGVLSLAAALVVVVGIVLDSEPLFVGAAVGYIAVLPPIIGAAVLRYRLYDLDRIISRTISYGLLTVLLGLAYALLVLGLGPWLGPLLGRGSSASLAVAGATLAVAAAFQPARRRIQDLVDRRFNRRRYDAERTIAAFSGRLRQQTDLDALTSELLTVVDQTMQPTRAALWLRPLADPGKRGAHVQG